MNTKGKVKTVTIPIDFSKTIGKPDAKDVVLLYDEACNCYYRASLSHVIGAAIKVVNEKNAEMAKAFEEEKAKNEKFRKELKERQDAFISDTNTIIKSIIDLVEGGTKK